MPTTKMSVVCKHCHTAITKLESDPGTINTLADAIVKLATNVHAQTAHVPGTKLDFDVRIEPIRIATLN